MDGWIAVITILTALWRFFGRMHCPGCPILGFIYLLVGGGGWMIALRPALILSCHSFTRLHSFSMAWMDNDDSLSKQHQSPFVCTHRRLSLSRWSGWMAQSQSGLIGRKGIYRPDWPPPQEAIYSTSSIDPLPPPPLPRLLSLLPRRVWVVLYEEAPALIRSIPSHSCRAHLSIIL